ncbi:cAMP-binding protein [Desulfosporosinus orientis DSM 765]|uniref:cAMP-binding protein n=1 Tax=Desulfosporosinus orientis (strain ATCC 19365 / DSM 765 / NCIMB 8382 / VKM B-1628 / Singapore I) TaxID=768706 RepID=G7WEM0_DESOD|nr:Crp/Fnr family transcriptional regulator [Desulfosporosinus orientis]AET66911.1 cAMP-binding protein [Desulfosporosinus orientis DSM 765]
MSDKTNELIEFITTSIIFDETTLESEGLSSSVWDKYLELGCRTVKMPGDYIIYPGENLKGCFFIKRGKLKSNFIGKDGATKILSIIGNGATFGEQFVFHSQPGLFEAIVMSESELYFFTRDKMLELCKKDFEISLFMLKTLAIKSRMLAIQLEDTCVRNTMQNICRILYTFCCYEENNGQSSDGISILLTHEDLANMIGAHRVTITKNLNKLKKLKVLNYKYEKVTVLNTHMLKEFAFN